MPMLTDSGINIIDMVASYSTTGVHKMNNFFFSVGRNVISLGSPLGRSRGRVVRALDLKAGGSGFKSRSDH